MHDPRFTAANHHAAMMAYTVIALVVIPLLFVALLAIREMIDTIPMVLRLRRIRAAWQANQRCRPLPHSATPGSRSSRGVVGAKPLTSTRVTVSRR